MPGPPEVSPNGTQQRTAGPADAWSAFVERWLALALGVLATVPVLVSLLRALADNWTPVYDDAIIATNAFDMLTSETRAVGVYSDASVPDVGPIYNLGPLPLWLLALPARVPGDWALPVMAALINAACVVGVVLLARRRGGDPLMVATAVALALLLRSVPAEALHSILNPSLALLPLTLLLFLSWSVACGDFRLLPLTALVASFVIQAHVSVAIPAVPAVLVALAGLAIFPRRRTGSGRRNPALRRSALAALAVITVCWVVPVADELVDRPGNVRKAIWTSRVEQPTVGLDAGWNSLVRATGAWPWWLRDNQQETIRVFEVHGRPGVVATVSSMILLVGLVLVALLARRRRRDIAAAAVLALLLNLAIVIGVSLTPERLAAFANKSTLWANPVGMFSWLVVGWSSATLAAERWRPAHRTLGRLPVFRTRAAAVAAFAVVALVAALSSASQEGDFLRAVYGPVRTIGDRLDDRLQRDATVEVVSAERTSLFRGDAVLTRALLYQLRRYGVHPVTGNNKYADQLGGYYDLKKHAADRLLVIDDHSQPTSPYARVLARVPASATQSEPDAGPAPFPARPITVSVVPRAALACPSPTPPSPPPARRFRSLHTVRRWVIGFVDHSTVFGRRALFCGWAGSTASHQAADLVALAVGQRLVAAVKPGRPRPDVLKTNPGIREENVGFSLSVPRRLITRDYGADDVQLIGIAAGRATPLRFLCTQKPQRWGC